MPDDDPLDTRQTLLLKIRDADNDDAWNEFADLYTPVIRNYCALRSVHQQDIPDVTQDVLATVARAIKKFEYDPDKGTFRDWLFIVTRSKVFNHFNKKKKQPQGTGRTTIHQLLEEQPDPKEQIDWDLEYKKQMFQWAADKVRPEFKEQTWEAFWQTAVDQVPTDTVAQSIGLSPGAVYVAKSRVIARLRARITTVTGHLDLPPNVA
ncbi:MAG: sigma-70 family RNA polymerase sigma factor [Verrucomicrobiota bacterium]